MNNHQRLGRALITIVLVTDRAFDHTKYIQFNTNLMASKPRFIFPDSEPGRATISQLLGWIATVKEIRIEQSHPMPYESLEEMQIILNDSEGIRVQPAANTLIHKDSKRTIFI